MPYYYPGYPGYPQHYFQLDPAEYKVKPKEWYGWQTIIVHGISVVTLLLSAAGDGTPAPVTIPLGMGGLLFGAPIVHWAHGYVGKGFGSLGLVLGGTVGGYLMTATTACVTGICQEGGGYGGLIAFFIAGPIGGGITLLAMNIVDYATLAYEEGGGPSPAAPQTPPSPKDGAPKWSMQPIIDIQRDRALLGVGGVF